MVGASLFDEGMFRLSHAEAVGLDPQCRLLLEHVWTAVQVGKTLRWCRLEIRVLAAWGLQKAERDVQPRATPGLDVDATCMIRYPTMLLLPRRTPHRRWLAPPPPQPARMWAACGASTKCSRCGRASYRAEFRSSQDVLP